MHLFPISLSLPLAACLIHHFSPSASFTHSISARPSLFTIVISSLLYLPRLSKLALVLQSIYIPWLISFSLQFKPLSLSLCHSSCSICFIIQVAPLSSSVSFSSPLYSCFSCHQEHHLPLFLISLNELSSPS